MTHEERARLVKRIFIVMMIAVIVAGTYLYPKLKWNRKPVEIKKPVAAANSQPGFLIVHHHLPGNPASEQIADILSKIQTKYEKELVVSRVDFQKHPEIAKAQGVTKPPHVVIFSGTQKVFEFQGLWTQIQVERKVEEILRGLIRVDKNWRPAVPGMKPVGG